MTVFAVKKGSESNERLMNRFKQQFQGTGLQKIARAIARRGKVKTKRTIRLSAIQREKNRAKNIKKKFYSNM